MPTTSGTDAPGPNGPRILVVEDNSGIASVIAEVLRAEGFLTDVALTGEEGETRSATGGYEVIVLDRMLPDKDGLEICRSIRARAVRSRVLMLTALDSAEQKIAGLDAGADDYLTKPFEFPELIARIRALLQRTDDVDVVERRQRVFPTA